MAIRARYLSANPKLPNPKGTFTKHLRLTPCQFQRQGQFSKLLDSNDQQTSGSKKHWLRSRSSPHVVKSHTVIIYRHEAPPKSEIGSESTAAAFSCSRKSFRSSNRIGRQGEEVKSAAIADKFPIKFKISMASRLGFWALACLHLPMLIYLLLVWSHFTQLWYTT